ncbi:MAG: DUF4157 domain-containing protein [Thermodesulfobacteriota bacterium]|nr:DUF4157 domain-containing protein [Thermodesulfobacteriota bacterium]
MAPRIVWRYRRKRPASAARNRKQNRGFSNIESQAAGSPPMQVMQVMEQQEVRPMIQFAEEEKIQAGIQLQEEEEAQAQLQEAEEEEEEEVQAQLQEEEEEEVQAKTESMQKRSNRLIRSVAKSGFKGNPGTYPFRQRIQAAFGSHDISNVKTFSDASAKKANTRLGALAYASREKVAFRGYPDLHTAAHEAAHIIQQRQGVRLKDGTGRKGDPYERHADAVADRVVQGKSVQSLLNSKPKS